MSNNWAYTAYGRTAADDFWEWFGPDAEKDAVISALMGSTRGKSPTKGINVIGFDGKNWFTGFAADLKEVLDPEKYDLERYGTDVLSGKGRGRKLDWLHGYTSESAQFPERIPLVDRQHYLDLHEKNVIPIWEHTPKQRWDGSVGRTVTTFGGVEAMHNPVSITGHVSEQAEALLREAHAAGKPIAIQYDAESKQWSRLERFEERFANDCSKPVAQAHVPTSSVGGANKTVENARSWVARLWEHPSGGGKIAIVGGVVSLGALIGYWAFKSKQNNGQEASLR
jgi:hypothetical protein